MLYELSRFGMGILLGIVLSCGFDLGRACRKEIAHSNFWVAVEDLGYWALAAIGFFCFLEKYNQGMIRFHFFLAAAFGIFLYMLIFHRLLFFIFCLFFRLVKKVFDYFGKIILLLKKVVKKTLILPLKNIIKEITIMIHNT